MKDIINCSKKIIVLSVLLAFFYSCSYISNNDNLPIPKIQAGKAKVVGKVTGFNKEDIEKSLIISLFLPHPVTAEMVIFQDTVKEDGSFFFDVPLESSPVIGFIQSKIYIGGVYLIADEESKIEIIKNESDDVKINIISSIRFPSEEMLIIREVSNELIDRYYNLSIDYKMDHEEYSSHVMKNIGEMLETLVYNNSELSDQAKNIVSVSYELFLKRSLFAYSFNIEKSFYENPENLMHKTEDFTLPQEPGKSYYSFINKLNLNNPKYLYTDCYFDILQLILNNDSLQIPAIKDIPVNDWLKTVKKNVDGIFSIEAGFFSDMLVANAYSQQMNDENKPLSIIQKNNIKKYFKNKSFVDILLKRSDEKEKKDDVSSYLKINEVPFVSKEELIAVQNNKQPQGKLLEAIVSNYKGKVVIIDFWTTSCIPCLKAIKTSEELKQEMLDKNVVFVYLTYTFSPKILWEKKIVDIGGEHFYLNSEEWKSISYSAKYGFNGVPYYLIFDKKGMLIHKFTSYPGNEKMQKMIEELL